MFALLTTTRSLARHTATVSQSLRYMSAATNPPPPPPPPPPSSSSSSAGGSSKDAPPETQQIDSAKKTLPTLDFSAAAVVDGEPEQESHHRQQQQQRTGARSSKGTLSTSEKKRRAMSRVTLALLGLGLGVHTVYMGREWDHDELTAMKKKREEVPASRWGRTKQRYSEVFDYFNKPAWTELLPPPYPPPHQKPYTLLLSVDDLLVTSTWDRQHGWRTAKRPGVDYFLAYISQFYEVVIFTTQPSYTAAPILDKLDKYGFFINHRLYREGTRSINGQIVKDLSYLNRDLSKVVLLDTHPEHVSTQPENAVIIPKWTGDPKDKGLVAMIPFLESIAIYKPTDVRRILKAYEGKDVPVEYGKVEAEMKARHVDEWKSKHKTVASVPSFGSLFGLSSSSSPATTTAAGVPPTYLEQKRIEAQRQYLEEQKYIRDNKAELERLLEHDQKMMAAQVPGNLWEAIDHFRGVAPPPPPPGAPTPAGTTTTTTTGAPVQSVSEAAVAVDVTGGTAKA